MVIVTDLSVSINNKKLLKNVSCTLVPGRITLFLGKSGAGKTTLLKTIASLLTPVQGTIIINNKLLKSLAPRQRSTEIGSVFQGFNLFPHLTVLENCIDPLIVSGFSKEESIKRATDALQELNMEKFSASYPGQLSGGQQQRVAIARALCLNPKVLLLDEPSAALDPDNAEIVAKILKKLALQGIMIGISSQDISFIKKIIDRTYFLESGTIIETCENKTQVEQAYSIKRFITEQ